MFDTLITWQVDLVQSQAARNAFRASKGFCPHHMWLLKQIGDPLSLSKAFAPVVAEWADDLRQVVGGPSDQAAGYLTAALPRQDACIVCDVEHDTGAGELGRVLASLATGDGRDRFVRGPGLCLRHVGSALRTSPPPDLVTFLLRDCVRRLEDVSAELLSFADKRDAGRRDLLTDGECDAWQRALVLLAGVRTLGAEGDR